MPRRIDYLVAGLLAITAAGQAAESAEGVASQQTTIRALIAGSAPLRAELLRAGFDVSAVPGTQWTGSDAGMVFYGEPRELQRLRDAYPNLVVLTTSRGRPFREVVGPARAAAIDVPDSRYRDASEINADLLAVANLHPTIAQRVNLTQAYGAPQTHGGRDIYALKVSDNVSQDEDEPAILVVSNHHAREINTVELSFEVIDRLVTWYTGDPRYTNLIDNHVIWIVPTMNPDGLEHMWNVDDGWRKNRRDNGDGTFGVDLNRNYPYFWSRCGSSNATNSGTYHGPGPGSEPETQTMLAFAAAERFERVWDQHSHGRDVRWSYNPLTVGQIPPPVGGIYDGLQQRIATAMGYQVNSSCCCGGNQHWHFATHGALAYLGEMGTAFQPDWLDTHNELNRMWTGIELFMFEPTPLVGHVRVLGSGTPIEAQIRLPAAPFVDGQERWSEPRFGRYSVWLQPGTYDLEFVANGYLPRTVQVSIQGGQSSVLDVDLQPVVGRMSVGSQGAPAVGQSVPIHISSPEDAGAPYFLGLSQATTPAMQVGGRQIPLADGWLLASIPAWPAVFENFIGTLDRQGTATATLHLPNLPSLSGLTLHAAAVTFAGAGQVANVSAGTTLIVQ